MAEDNFWGFEPWENGIFKMQFQSSQLELDYIDKCLQFMDNHISNEFDKISKSYEEDLKQITSNKILEYGRTEKEFLDDEYMDRYGEHEDIAKTFLEAILIRQVAIIEKFLINLSFEIYRKKSKNNQTNILPPNANLDENFTNSDKAANYINEHLNINLKGGNNWKIFQVSRHIRHKLAHGEKIFFLKDEYVRNYNQNFSEPILELYQSIPGEEYDKYKTTNNPKSLQILNKSFYDFIDEIEILIVPNIQIISHEIFS